MSVAPSGPGNGEHDPGGLGVHEALDEDSHCRITRHPVLAGAAAVVDGACRVQRRPTGTDRIDNLIDALHRKDALVLAGRRSLTGHLSTATG